MIIERKNKELIIRLSADLGPEKIQSILDYLRYVEITSKTTVSDEAVAALLKTAKKGRFEKIKKEIGFEN